LFMQGCGRTKYIAKHRNARGCPVVWIQSRFDTSRFDTNQTRFDTHRHAKSFWYNNLHKLRRFVSLKTRITSAYINSSTSISLLYYWTSARVNVQYVYEILQVSDTCKLKMSVCMASMCSPVTVNILKSVSRLLS